MTLTPEQKAEGRKHPISVAVLRKLVRYNPITGTLEWLPRTSDLFLEGKYHPERACAAYNSRNAGKAAFTAKTADGYLMGRIWNHPYYAHRVAYALYYGEWPEGHVDHINGDRADNRAFNLRDVPAEINARNMRWKGASEMRGVRRKKGTHAWQARINHDGKEQYLGSFATSGQAIAARREAEAKYGYHENHGRSL